MNKKGFTIVELLGVMVILGIIMVIALNEYRKYIKQTTDRAYEIITENVNSAVENYLMDHPKAKNVDIEKLVEEDYLEEIVDPEGNDNETCRGRVKIEKKNNDSSDEIDSNYYIANICCKHNNYTYDSKREASFQDKYCKADPYDLRKIKNIRVLNVYPVESAKDNVKTWMDNYGKGIIHVTPVNLADFKANPKTYLGEENAWNYDVVIFGFWDCNGFCSPNYAKSDLDERSRNAVVEYMNSGGSVIFGHDTIMPGHPYFVSIAGYVDVSTKSVPNTRYGYVKLERKGIFTTYPYDIGEEGTYLEIPTSHVSSQVPNNEENVWLTFDTDNNDATINTDPAVKRVYLTTYRNNAFIQTGHSNGAAKPSEQMILANIIFYTMARQYSDAEEME